MSSSSGYASTTPSMVISTSIDLKKASYAEETPLPCANRTGAAEQASLGSGNGIARMPTPGSADDAAASSSEVASSSPAKHLGAEPLPLRTLRLRRCRSNQTPPIPQLSSEPEVEPSLSVEHSKKRRRKSETAPDNVLPSTAPPASRGNRSRQRDDVTHGYPSSSSPEPCSSDSEEQLSLETDLEYTEGSSSPSPSTSDSEEEDGNEMTGVAMTPKQKAIFQSLLKGTRSNVFCSHEPTLDRLRQRLRGRAEVGKNVLIPFPKARLPRPKARNLSESVTLRLLSVPGSFWPEDLYLLVDRKNGDGFTFGWRDLDDVARRHWVVFAEWVSLAAEDTARDMEHERLRSSVMAARELEKKAEEGKAKAFARWEEACVDRKRRWKEAGVVRPERWPLLPAPPIFTGCQWKF